MVVDIRNYFYDLPRNSSITVLIRAIDGLTINIDSFKNFLEMVEATGTKMQLIWTYKKVYDTIRHPSMCLYKGIGSVLAIKASEFLQHLREEIDSAAVQKY